MKNIFRSNAERLIRSGAQPWRVSPARGDIRLLHVPETHLLVVAVAAVAITLGTLAVAALLFDLRPARSRDIRIAAIIRSAVSNVDELSSDDLRARMSVSPELARTLAV